MPAAGLAATVNTGDPPMSASVAAPAVLGRAGVARLVADGVSAAFLDPAAKRALLTEVGEARAGLSLR
jgi:adenosine deaminase